MFGIGAGMAVLTDVKDRSEAVFGRLMGPQHKRWLHRDGQLVSRHWFGREPVPYYESGSAELDELALLLSS